MRHFSGSGDRVRWLSSFALNREIIGRHADALPFRKITTASLALGGSRGDLCRRGGNFRRTSPGTVPGYRRGGHLAEAPEAANDRQAMHTTAHPDDEHGGVLAMLSRGQGASVSLLTLTRGESGDNAIGPELFDALGLMRTENS